MLMVKFELRKRLKENKILLLLITTIVLSLAYSAMKTQFDKRNYSQESNEVLMLRLDAFSQANQAQSEIERLMEQGLDITEALEHKKYLQSLSDALDRLSVNILIGNWDTNLMYRMEVAQLRGESQEVIDKYKYMIDNNIPYIYEDLNMNGSNFLFIYLKEGLPLILIIVLIVAITSSYGREIEDGTIKTLLFEPLPDDSIWISKMVADIIIVIPIVMFSTIFLYIYHIIRNGLGSIDYPYFINNGEWVSMLHYLPSIILMLIVQIIFMVVLYNFISLKMKNTIMTFLSLTALSGIIYFVPRYFDIPYLQFIGLDMVNLIRGGHNILIMLFAYIVLIALLLKASKVTFKSIRV